MKPKKIIFVVPGLILSLILIFTQHSFAAPITASTSLTIVNVTVIEGNNFSDSPNWGGAWPSSPDATINPTGLEVYLYGVNLESHSISWQTNPGYTPYFKFPDGVNSILSTVWSTDQGKTFKRISWDYLGPTTHAKELDEGMPNCWVGTYIQTVNGLNGELRSNLYFTEYPTGTTNCWGTVL
jgi:hypothetical protein